MLPRCRGVATFFTSDSHFGDHRTINIHKRPFVSTTEMDAALIRNWNAAVGPDDEVWHLGDFASKPAAAAALLERLHGRKHLLRGNNDPDGTCTAPGWASIGDYAEITHENRFLVLCHYPFRSWNRQHRGAINLHGHSHGRLKPVLRQFDVGVDARSWRPVRLAEILATAEPGPSPKR